LKNIEGQLVEAGEMPEIPSYFMECLAYNVSHGIYSSADTWREIVRGVCAQIWGYAKEPEPNIGRWLEVNGCKWLFHPDQRWTREDAQRFATLAFGMVS